MGGSLVLDVDLGSRGATRRLGHALADCLRPGDLVVLEGDLGAGKTFLSRAVARGLGVPGDVPVTSPTFELVHELPARLPLVHVDLYRLDTADALRELGLNDRIGRDAVVLVEWGARFLDALGGEGVLLTLQLGAGSTRRCTMSAHGIRGQALLERIADVLNRGDLRGISKRFAAT